MIRKHSKIFYGWWIVGACFANSLLVAGVIILGFTAFFEPIAKEFGWSYAQISLAASLRGVESGILSPLLGLVIDRWGPRKLLFAGMLFLGIGLMLLSRTNSLGMFYGAFALVAIGTSGSSPTVTMTAVANWFRLKVGMAIGIMASGFACGSLLVPVVVKLIDVFDWRATAFMLGAGTLIIGLPLSLLVRHKPEQYGYLPDGATGATLDIENAKSSHSEEVDIGVKQILTSRTFWHLASSLTCPFLAISAVIVHIMPSLSSIGIERSTASLVATAIPLVSISGRLSSGWLSDKFNKKLVTCGCLALMGIGMLCLYYASNEAIWLVVPFTILFGIGYGGNATMRAALLRQYFGRRRFGTVLGFVMGILSLGNIVGPIFAGWVFDNWNSYYAAWLAFACLNLVAIIILATTPPIRSNKAITR